jgi:hypothetical protein
VRKDHPLLFSKEFTMPAPSPATQALITQAYADLDSAQGADADDARAVQALQAAQAAEDATKAASVAAHKTALASAQQAISAMAQELRYNLPTNQ